jgi:hypothetical protein
LVGKRGDLDDEIDESDRTQGTIGRYPSEVSKCKLA